jgi:drug/metabolite transporter (DMT)-like permease
MAWLPGACFSHLHDHAKSSRQWWRSVAAFEIMMAPSAALAFDSALPDATPAPATAARAAPRDLPLRGILLILGSTAFFSCADVITKAMSATLPAVEIAWLRYLVFSAMAVPLVLGVKGRAALRATHPGLQLWRGLCVVASALLSTLALGYLPVAEATALNFISPVFITALSIVFLGESVGWRRWTAAAVGLAGVLIIVRPGTGAFQSTALIPLLAALIWAAAAIATRKMSADHAATTLAYSAMIGLAVLTALLPFHWVPMGWRDIGLGLALGIFSSTGHGLVVLAYQRAAASTLAPFSYVQLVGSAALGFVVFGALPDGWTFVGAAVIVGSGLYTAHRERLRARARREAAVAEDLAPAGTVAGR